MNVETVTTLSDDKRDLRIELIETRDDGAKRSARIGLEGRLDGPWTDETIQQECEAVREFLLWMLAAQPFEKAA